jgi:hypothetical protein
MEAVVAQFKILSRHLAEGTEENHNKPIKSGTLFKLYNVYCRL